MEERGGVFEIKSMPRLPPRVNGGMQQREAEIARFFSPTENLNNADEDDKTYDDEDDDDGDGEIADW